MKVAKQSGNSWFTNRCLYQINLILKSYFRLLQLLSCPQLFRQCWRKTLSGKISSKIGMCLLQLNKILLSRVARCSRCWQKIIFLNEMQWEGETEWQALLPYLRKINLTSNLTRNYQRTTWSHVTWWLVIRLTNRVTLTSVFRELESV